MSTRRYLFYRLLLGVFLSAVLFTSHQALCEEQADGKTIVYYFHRTVRCPSCNQIEYLTKTAVQLGFSDEIEAGKMELAIINVDEPSYAHFIDDYRLESQSVILSRVIDGKQQRWRNLDKVWDLFHQDTEFIEYVQKEIRAFTSPVKSSRITHEP